ncbi:ABC transporter ATP-binding protein/permease [Alphaproteobacteria bacterium]|nr:ABC transporter ATP-binding protein/permease [Alphaproteobacteria bacterium]
MNNFQKIIAIFYAFIKQFPFNFFIIFILLCIEAIVAVSSVLFIIPLADFMLDPQLSNPSIITTYISNGLSKFSINPDIISFSLFFILSNFIKGILDVFIRYWILVLKYSVFRQIILKSLNSIMNANWSFFTRNDQGKLLNSLQREASNVSDTMSQMATQFSQIVQVIIYLVLPMILNPVMTFSTILLVLIFAIPFLFFHGIGYRLGLKNTSTANTMISNLAETLSSMRLILSFSSKEIELQRNRKSIDNHFSASVKSQTFIAAIGFMFQPLAITAAIISIGIALSQNTPLTEIVAILWSLLRAMPLISRMLQTNISISNFIPSYEQLERLTTLANSSRLNLGKNNLKGFNKNLKIENISFKYKESPLILNNVTMNIKIGSITGLCGHSGAGKSTLIDIILRLQNPDAGTIKVDGQNLMLTEMKQYRDYIGYVPQDPRLFNISVRDNIKWANSNATEEEIMQSLSYANALDFVNELPNGIDTLVGESGGQLSGGQRQRITIARALIRHPKLLILDEATSSLDVHAQEEILNTLLKLKNNMAILLITHQPQMLKHADAIYKLEGGMILKVDEIS